MSDKVTFKVFGFTEQEIRARLSEQKISAMLVEEYCRDAKVVILSDESKKDELAFYIYNMFRGCVYRDSDGTLAETVLERLRLYGKTLAVSESLTGGMIASKLVEVPGCSECFTEGLVTYSNEAKIARLGVEPSTLRTFGAVSSQVAKQMAMGLKHTGVHYALSTTGIAGPGGGSEQKPVGLVYIGVADEFDCHVTECRFDGTREEIRTLAANTALFLLWKKLVKPIDFESMVIE